MMVIGLRGCSVQCIIGCNPDEREMVQELIFDVEYTLSKILSDDLSTSIDYMQVLDFIRTMLQEREYFLIEYAVQEIAQELLSAFPKMNEVSLMLHKLHPETGVNESYAKACVEREL